MKCLKRCSAPVLQGAKERKREIWRDEKKKPRKGNENFSHAFHTLTKSSSISNLPVRKRTMTSNTALNHCSINAQTIQAKSHNHWCACEKKWLLCYSLGVRILKSIWSQHFIFQFNSVLFNFIAIFFFFYLQWILSHCSFKEIYKLQIYIFNVGIYP